MADSSKSTTPRARRREALHQALVSVLGPDRAHTAIGLWEKLAAERGRMTVIELVNELAGPLQMDEGERHGLRMALYKSLDAAPMQPGAAPPSKPTMAPTPPAFVVFQSMGESILKGMKLAPNPGWYDFTQLLTKHLPLATSAVVRRWAIEGANLDALMSLAPPDYAAVIHGLYITACEAVGPVAADRLLTHAVSTAGALPEAAQFPPNRLL
ncbi:hypothetical protein RM530_04765 [Algiphilus sp. W345]|uniref:Uncharacterized protein n=1 Tax=Banduia mediterranea TaxID=3075609 RepID=A0ABU2WFL3_9GAMM|nr:hypothetical protein [Algiphilus sp. W345]MDT0496673.1 hypothetical protein [Algiphilus sp. W345]